jgi:hypothetical protein
MLPLMQKVVNWLGMQYGCRQDTSCWKGSPHTSHVYFCSNSFGSKAQRKLGFDDFFKRLSDSGKSYYEHTVRGYLAMTSCTTLIYYF